MAIAAEIFIGASYKRKRPAAFARWALKPSRNQHAMEEDSVPEATEPPDHVPVKMLAKT
jgi:hypothetical protein